MRLSLSRLYSANYHVAADITQGKSHGDIAKKLGDRYGDVGETFKGLRRLRNRMDYSPDFFLTELKGKDPGEWYRVQMGNGIELYQRLRAIWDITQRV